MPPSSGDCQKPTAKHRNVWPWQLIAPKKIYGPSDAHLLATFIWRLLLQDFRFQWSNPMSHDSQVISSFPIAVLQHCTFGLGSGRTDIHESPFNRTALGISCHVSGSSPVMSGTAMRRGFARSSERRGKVQFGIGRT